MNENNVYEPGLTMIPGIGDGLAKQLISYCGSAEQIFKSSKKKLLSIPNIGEKLADNIINHKDVLIAAEQVLKKAQLENVKLLFYLNHDYPHRLKQIPDSPVLIYYKGTANLNHTKVISIVGTRKSTQYGKEITEKIIDTLQVQQPLIVSGLAYGIDIIAHRASLKSNLPTIGVMANGIDKIYPSQHSRTAEEMVAQGGGLLTEYPFGTNPETGHFPARNRIVAGMCDAVIVVEAAEKGGALITADIANGYDREVFAVPGRIGDIYSAGCNNLIRDHKAHILSSPDDVVKLLNWDIIHSKKKGTKTIPEDLTEEELKLYQVMADGMEIHIDELSWKAQISINQTASLLLPMEFRNIVKALPGKKFKLA